MTVPTRSPRSADSTLSYERNGSGAPLVLIHGLGSDRHVWDPVMTHLTDRYDVIRIDLPGHGNSPRMAPGSDASAAGMNAHLEHLLNHLELDSVHVVGSSLGGWVALELALAGRASSVTALAPAGFWSSELVPVVAHANRWAARLVLPIAPMLLRSPALRTVGFWSSSADPAALDPELAARATHAQATASGWAAALAATHHSHCNAQSIDAAVPVTVVWGDRDRILPAGSCQESAGLPPHARWIRLSRCGHVPMWDQPVATLQLLDDTVAAARPRQRTSSVMPHS